MLNELNWNYASYQNQDLKIFLSQEAGLCEGELKISYLVNITDEFDNDLFQKNFVTISDACRYVNNKYSHLWEFQSNETKSGSGCSSCVAH